MNGPLRVTVMGLGLFGGGAGAARFYAERGHQVTVTDLRDAGTLAPAVEKLAGLDVRFRLGGHDEADFAGCDLLVVNPGVRPADRYVELARASGARVATEFGLGLELAERRGARALAVTGSNGKSTTCAMLTAAVRAADPRTRGGGNIGGSLLVSACELPEGAPLVLEVSSFQLERLERFPGLAVAVVTNLAPNHLDWHDSVESYYAAKKRLLGFLPPGGKAVLNARDPVLLEWGAGLGGRAVWFSGDETGPMARVIEGARLAGPHDAENALAAAHAAAAFGVDEDRIAEGLASFAPLRHRLEEVARAGGLRFVDDSSSTTPESTIVALRAVSGPVALIAGGSDKGLSFEALAAEIAQRAVGAAVMGRAGAKIADAVRACLRADTHGQAAGRAPGVGVRLAEVADLEGAVTAAAGFLEGSGTVLLSPAAASLDAFANYVRRGERFAEIARAFGGRAR